ncbi:MAG: choice-of-anchor M domain-containing protein [Haloferula sp.]
MKFPTRRSTKGLALSSLAFCFLSGAANAASVVTAGHIDAPAFGYVPGDGFEPHIHNEGGPDGAIIDGVRVETNEEYEPTDLIFQVQLSSTTTVDTTDYYWLPEVDVDANNNNVPWMGIGFEELVETVENTANLDFVNDTFTISLNVISAPTGAEFRMWQDDGFGGANDFINTATNDLSFDHNPFLADQDHIHVNWGFTEQGTYELEFTITGTRVGETESESASGVYTFAVPEPSTTLLGALGGLFLLRRRRN